MSNVKSQSLIVTMPDRSDVKVYLTPEQTRALDARLARIEGHVRAIRRMLAEEQDCDNGPSALC